LFQDPRGWMPVPGVEVERHSNGRVTIRIVGRAEPGKQSRLPAAAWQRLRKFEADTFAPERYVPPTLTQRSRPKSICHGWLVRLGSAQKGAIGSQSWSQCGGEPDRRYAFAVEMARLAVSSTPDCKFDQLRPFYSYAGCFARFPWGKGKKLP
jgi:hypothetical protein